jgi:hypothetical protein
MSTLVAARLWVCEYCNKGYYDQNDIIEHLKEKT